MLHPDDADYFNYLKKLGKEVAQRRDIVVWTIEPKRRPGKGETAMGLCYAEEKRISVKVRNKAYKKDGGAWEEKRIPHFENLNTVAHELAHLWELQLHGETYHGERFWRYFRDLFSLIKMLDNMYAEEHSIDYF